MSNVNSTQSIAENYSRYAKYFEKQDKDSFSLDSFFNLLMAEMSNQDPLEPTSNTEFVSQLANFTSLRAQQDALYYQNANYAQSLVGKTVSVMGYSGKNYGLENGIVTSVTLVEGEFSVKVNGSNYSLNQIMEVLPTHNPYAVTGYDGAFATSLIGKTVTTMVKNSAGQSVTETGVVSHIEIKNNEISVIILDKDGKNLAYPLDSVVKVENTASGDEEEFHSEGSSGTQGASNTGNTGGTTGSDPDDDDPDVTGADDGI